MLVTTTEMLATTQNMNTAYNMECTPDSVYHMTPFSKANDKKLLCL